MLLHFNAALHEPVALPIGVECQIARHRVDAFGGIGHFTRRKSMERFATKRPFGHWR